MSGERRAGEPAAGRAGQLAVVLPLVPRDRGQVPVPREPSSRFSSERPTWQSSAL